MGIYMIIIDMISMKITNSINSDSDKKILKWQKKN